VLMIFKLKPCTTNSMYK